jgi:translation initiation factor IF-3
VRERGPNINQRIRAKEVRVVGADGANLGVLETPVAIQKAMDAKMDLIEISPNATPPVAKIMDYGKFQYDQKKKRQNSRQKAHTTETKTVQVKIGTGGHDLELKAKKASDWLREGDRIKLDLFLPGRTKYMERSFLEERMNRMLKLITEEYKIADPPKKSPKGLTVILERKGK